MAARVARKEELLKAKRKGGGQKIPGVNSNAGANLRSRLAIENAKIAMEKQKEMKSRDKMERRDNLCKMLGRGC